MEWNSITQSLLVSSILFSCLSDIEQIIMHPNNRILNSSMMMSDYSTNVISHAQPGVVQQSHSTCCIKVSQHAMVMGSLVP